MTKEQLEENNISYIEVFNTTALIYYVCYNKPIAYEGRMGNVELFAIEKDLYILDKRNSND